MNEEGACVDDNEELKSMAMRFYQKLFESDPTTGGEFVAGCLQHLDNSTKEELGKEVTVEKTKRALKDMGCYKAPSPDGF